MNRKIVLVMVLSMTGILTNAQTSPGKVGINTTSPNATLDVAGNPTDVNAADGILAPRLTGDELKAKDALYDTPQIGTLVYATAAANPTTTKTINVTSEGYYYFDSNKVWQKVVNGTGVANGNFWALTGNSGTNPVPSGTQFLGTTDAQDFQVKVNNSEIMRVKNSNGHVHYGNILDRSASPNVQDADRNWTGGTATLSTSYQNLPSSFAVGNEITSIPAGNSGTANVRFNSVVTGAVNNNYFGTYLFDVLRGGGTAPIRGLFQNLFLDNGATYSGQTISGNASTVTIRTTTTTATPGLFTAAYDGTFNNAGTVSGSGYVAGLKAQVGGAGNFSVPNIYGVRGLLTGGNISGNGIGVEGFISSGTYGTGTQSIGLRSEVSASQVKNGYGLYIGTINGTDSQYGIYQSDADNNILFGNTRIGNTTNPVATLDVAGTARVSNTTASTATKILGTDTNGQLNDITLGSGLGLSAGTLSNTGVTGLSATAPITVSASTGTATIAITRNDLNTGTSSSTATNPVTITNGTSAVVNGANTSVTVNNTAPLWNANQLQGANVSTAVPTDKQYLKYNGTTSQWEPTTVDKSGASATNTGTQSFVITAGTSSTTQIALNNKTFGGKVADNLNEFDISTGKFTAKGDGVRVFSIAYNFTRSGTGATPVISFAINGVSGSSQSINTSGTTITGTYIFAAYLTNGSTYYPEINITLGGSTNQTYTFTPNSNFFVVTQP